MASSIALNIRKKVRALKAEEEHACPMGRCIVLEEEPWGAAWGRSAAKVYTVTATYRKSLERKPLAVVAAVKRGFLGFGYYEIIDNTRNGTDNSVGCELTYPEADYMAYERALKIASVLGERMEFPLVDHTRRGGKIGISVETLIKKAAELASEMRS